MSTIPPLPVAASSSPRAPAIQVQTAHLKPRAASYLDTPSSTPANEASDKPEGLAALALAALSSEALLPPSEHNGVSVPNFPVQIKSESGRMVPPPAELHNSAASNHDAAFAAGSPPPLGSAAAAWAEGYALDRKVDDDGSMPLAMPPRMVDAAGMELVPHPPAALPVCYRHQPDVRARERRPDLDMLVDSLSPHVKADVVSMWSQFASAPSHVREIMLLGLLDTCCMRQLTVASRAIAPVMKMDMLVQLPPELALRVLHYLDARSLCRASQVSKSWERLANDDDVWHRMCLQHIDRKCTKCGWGLPLLSRKRKRRCLSDMGGVGAAVAAASAANIAIKREERTLSPSPAPSAGYKPVPDKEATPELPAKRRSVTPPPPPRQTSLPPAPTTCAGQMPVLRAVTAPQAHLRGHHELSDSYDSDDVATLAGSPSATPRKRPRLLDVADASSPSIPSVPGTMLARKGSNGGVVKHEASICPRQGGGSEHKLALEPEQHHDLLMSRRSRRNWKAVYAERLVVERNWRRNGHVLFPLVPPTASLQPRITACYLDEPYLMTAGMDGLVRLWNLEQRTCVQTLVGHRGAVTCVHFDETKYLALSGGMDGTVRIWNYATGACVRSLTGGHAVPVTSLHFDGGVLASADAASLIRVWDFEAKSCFSLCHGNLCAVTRVVLCKGYLYSAGEDGVVRMWDLKTRGCVRTFLPPAPDAATSGASGNTAATAPPLTATSAPGAPGLLSPATAASAPPLSAASPAVTSLHVANVHVGGGHAVYLLTGSADGMLHLFSASSGSPATGSGTNGPAAHSSTPTSGIESISSSSAAGSTMTACRPLLSLSHGAPVTSVWFDSLRMLSCGTDGAVHLWDLESGERLRSYAVGGTAGIVTGSCTRIVCAREDGVVHVWDFGRRL